MGIAKRAPKSARPSDERIPSPGARASSACAHIPKLHPGANNRPHIEKRVPQGATLHAQDAMCPCRRTVHAPKAQDVFNAHPEQCTSLEQRAP